MNSPHPFASYSLIEQNSFADRQDSLTRQTLINNTKDLFTFLGMQTSLQDILDQLPGCLAEIFNAEHCLVIPSRAIESRTPHSEDSSVSEKFTNQCEQVDGADRFSILQHVMASGRSLLIESIEKSKGAEKMEHLSKTLPESMIFSPILINERVFGVVNVNRPRDKRCFDQEDLDLLDMITLFLAKSIQLTRLQDSMDIRFIQLALAQNRENPIHQVQVDSVPHLDKMARIVAKSFYREMAKAGFGSHQIVNAAAEIISELNSSLRKHGKTNGG